MFEGLHDHEDDEDIDELFAGAAEDDEMLDERRRARRVPSFRPANGGMAVFPGSLQPTGPGVQSATITTPRGSATVRLPEPVVTERGLKEALAKLESTLNTLSTQVAANRSALDDARSASASAHGQLSDRQRKLAKAAKASLQKMRKQQQMSMLLGAGAAALVQRENDKKFDAHLHSVGGNPSTVPNTLANKNLPLLLLAPMLPSLFGNGGKLGGSEMTPLLIAGGLAFMVMKDTTTAAAKITP